jgi:hypothetical protein
VADTSTKVEKMSTLVSDSRDSLSARLSAVEAKLEGIDKKLDVAVAKKANATLQSWVGSGKEISSVARPSDEAGR